jgi:diguanylate cyclase (GGDEF)-like protein
MRKSISGTVLRLVIILLGILVFLATPAYFIYRDAQEIIIRELGKNAVNIAATISEFTERNIEKYMTIPLSSYELFNGDSTEPADANTDAAQQNGGGPEAEESAFYEELTGIFNTLMETTGAQNIYIEKRVSETQKAYMFKEGFQQRTRYYAAILLSESEIRVYENGVPESSGLLTDDMVGAYISGYAPIKDSEDNVAGIVAVEFSMKYAEDIINGVRNIIFFSFGAVTLLTTVVMNLLVVSRQKYYKKDYLTELCNKSYFEKRLRSAVRIARDKHRPLTLMMIDVDHFKNLNDNYGHQIGDSILKSVSETLLRLTRDSDICARFGGDEFVILLTDTEKAQAFYVAERIRDEAARQQFFCGNNVISVTLSIGIAGHMPGMTAENLTLFADQAMYASKSSGKNKVSILN